MATPREHNHMLWLLLTTAQKLPGLLPSHCAHAAAHAALEHTLMLSRQRAPAKPPAGPTKLHQTDWVSQTGSHRAPAAARAVLAHSSTFTSGRALRMAMACRSSPSPPDPRITASIRPTTCVVSGGGRAMCVWGGERAVCAGR